MPGRFRLAAVADDAAFAASEFSRTHLVYSIDDELVSWRERGDGFFSSVVSMRARSPPFLCTQLYEPFYADFGPLNLGKTYRFCARTAELLEVRGRVFWRDNLQRAFAAPASPLTSRATVYPSSRWLGGTRERWQAGVGVDFNDAGLQKATTGD